MYIKKTYYSELIIGLIGFQFVSIYTSFFRNIFAVKIQILAHDN